MPDKLEKAFKASPLLEKALTPAAVAKINKAAPVDVRDADAHLEGRPVMLLSNLFSLEDWTYNSGLYEQGEEPADVCALRIMLADLGRIKAAEYVELINADPSVYTPVSQSQLDRWAQYLHAERGI